MIPALIQATLLSLVAVTVVLVAIPRLSLTRHRLLSKDACVVQVEHPMTLLEELQAKLLAKVGAGAGSGPIAAHIPEAMSSQTEEPTISPPNTPPDPPAIDSGSSSTEER